MLWRISEFPELDHLETGERADVLRRVPGWTYPLLVARAVVGGLLAGGTVGMFVARRPNEVIFMTTLCAAGLVAVVIYQLQLKQLRRLMREELAKGFHGTRPPFCFSCGYDLRGTTGWHCPECGQGVLTPRRRAI
jgi:hypothetical protein